MNLVLVPMLIGTWELGRVVIVQQLVANSAREGARLAAQAVVITESGTPFQIVKTIAPASNSAKLPNVKAAVYQSLIGAGLTNLTWSDVTVDFAFINPGMSPLPVPVAPAALPAAATDEPYKGVKGQRFTVRVSIPYSKVQWTILGIVKPATIEYTVEWRMLVDDSFNIKTPLPGW